eukprot:3490984-Amphidinium_carterae.1
MDDYDNDDDDDDAADDDDDDDADADDNDQLLHTVSAWQTTAMPRARKVIQEDEKKKLEKWHILFLLFLLALGLRLC